MLIWSPDMDMFMHHSLGRMGHHNLHLAARETLELLIPNLQVVVVRPAASSLLLILIAGQDTTLFDVNGNPFVLDFPALFAVLLGGLRSEEHTSELQSLR